MSEAQVIFVGAGPGAEDLLTLRGAAALEGADLVLYAGSLVNPALLRRCRPGCSRLDSAGGNRRCIDLLMGHVSKDTGNRVYNHKTLAELQATVELLTI